MDKKTVMPHFIKFNYNITYDKIISVLELFYLTLNCLFGSLTNRHNASEVCLQQPEKLVQ